MQANPASHGDTWLAALSQTVCTSRNWGQTPGKGRAVGDGLLGKLKLFLRILFLQKVMDEDKAITLGIFNHVWQKFSNNVLKFLE